ncbi:MAG TPA: YraN family protein [Bacillota bacterium]|jgi:putative endonuclease|nr:YraN family protein [Candidatus Fermentithermobacillaceae bacterium]HOA71238.1 YraN family protein [Bacillota bacterium]HPZ85797.1 YraN family protein [Bacillota bacterium]HQD86254.1 YraN family protein [Bacillota bacterium]
MKGRRSSPQCTGYMVETEVCDYLLQRDYRILYRNYRCGYGEIDIVAGHGTTLVFVEVRYRRRGSLVTPQESVSKSKIHKLRLAIRDFLYKHSSIARDYHGIRVDLVCASRKHDLQPLEFSIIQGAIEF